MSATPTPGQGVAWMLEGFGCEAARLADVAVLAALVDAAIDALALRPVAPAQWHRFPAPGGVTGFVMLAESHLALHTFPEHASICLDLFCCVPRPEWDWEGALARHLGAREVRVRRVERPYAGAPPRDGGPALATPRGAPCGAPLASAAALRPVGA